ncbi:MAG: hypothetical protein GQ523_10460 [Methanophagales archaeon]|jgi:hypothetical protein|nr:hypothetical protein [Methanophagales archaeon]
MYPEEAKSVWVKKGATLSDKSARNEFGLTQEEITVATTLRTRETRKSWHRSTKN